MQQKPSDLIPTRVGQKRPKLIGDFGTLIFIMAMVAHVAISGSVTLESPSAAAVLLSPVLFSAFPAVHQNRARVLLGNSRKMKNKNKTENRKLGHNNNVTLSWIPKISSEKREKKEHIQDSDFDFFTIQKSHPIHQFQNGEQKISRKRRPCRHAGFQLFQMLFLFLQLLLLALQLLRWDPDGDDLCPRVSCTP